MPATPRRARSRTRAGTTSIPALIARCTDQDDVVTAVQYANEQGVDIAIRSGGHGIDGFCMPEGALVIDTSPMKGIWVDPETRRVRIEAGVLLGEMDAATQEHGLVVPAGTVSETGAAGLILGGGIGYLTRRYGLTVDHLIEVEGVTADGRKIKASESENPELFWGLKGAGHNLIVGTAFTLNAVEVGPGRRQRPDHLPDRGGRPDPRQDRRGDGRGTARADDLPGRPPRAPAARTARGDDRRADLRPDRRLHRRARQARRGPRPGRRARHTARQHGPPLVLARGELDPRRPRAPGRRQHSRGGYLGGLTEEIGQAVVDRVKNAPAPTGAGPSCAVAFPQLGGALFDQDEDSAAYSRTDAEWLWEVLGQWDPVETDDDDIGWVDGTMDAIDPFALSNAYVNLSTDRGAEWLKNLYGSDEKWERIVALEARADPGQPLSHNKNVTRAVEELAPA